MIAVRLGEDPRGFAGNIQAISGQLEQPQPLAALIVDALLRHPRSREGMKQALAVAVRDASTFKTARALKPLVLSVRDFNDDQKAMMRDACVANVNIRDERYGGVAEAIYSITGRPPKPKPAASAWDDIPF